MNRIMDRRECFAHAARGAILGLLSLFLAAPVPVRADKPLEASAALLKLTPSNAGVVLTADDLRARSREILDSRLVRDFLALPAVKAWFGSEKYRQFEAGRNGIETFLGVTLNEIRDRLLGDAVVLALQFPPDVPLDSGQARGLLLLKARDPALLDRLIRLINDTQRQNGEITGLIERRRGDVKYFVREFPEDSGRLPDHYVTFEDGTFAISNGESLIHHVIDRRTGKGSGASTDAVDTGRTPGAAPSSLGEQPRFQHLSRRLPPHALARLYVDPRLLEQAMRNAPRLQSPSDQRKAEMLERYLGAMDYAGLALVVRDGKVLLHAAETFDSSKFPTLVGRWGEPAATTADPFSHLPPTALAVASAHLNFPALYEAVLSVIPDLDQTKLANIETVLSGLLLGQDLRTRILPGLGSRLVAVLEVPSESDLAPEPAARRFPFPLVVALRIGNTKEGDSTQSVPGGSPAVTVAAALDNALRTVLAVTTLDEKSGLARSRISSRRAAGTVVTTLDPPIPFAYAVGQKGHRLILGSSVEAVERYLKSAETSEGGKRFQRLQQAAFPEAESFVCFDLDAIHTQAERHRDRLTTAIAASQNRGSAEVTHDLEQVLALTHLFDAAFFTSRIDASGAAIHQTLGLLARDAGAKTRSTTKP